MISFLRKDERSILAKKKRHRDNTGHSEEMMANAFAWSV